MRTHPPLPRDWVNFGNINHQDYGGFFVKHLGGTRYAYIETECREDLLDNGEDDSNHWQEHYGRYRFYADEIDLADGWLDLKRVATSYDPGEFAQFPGEDQVCAAVCYHGHQVEPYYTNAYWTVLRNGMRNA